MDQENENKTSDLSLSLSLSMINPSNNIYKEKCFDRGKSKEEREEENDDDEEECNISKKKLRLTEGQYNVLERSFKKHATLNPKQKEFLARELNLQPRQVEVWFQNRRARTRFKQTEKNFELMRRYYEELIKENKRMEKELQELKAFKSTHKAPTVYMQQPEATLKMCPSCKRIFTTEVKPNRELIGSGSELKPDHDPL